MIARYAGGRALEPGVTLEEMGLSSLERIEMMVALEEALNTTIDETAFSNATTVADLERLAAAPAAAEPAAEPVEFPSWNRALPVPRAPRDRQPVFLLPLARVFAWITVEGLRESAQRQGTGDFRGESSEPHGRAGDSGGAARQMAPPRRHCDGEGIFQGAFFPGGVHARQRFTNSLKYYLSAAFFNTFPLPQREAGARQTLRYAGELISSGFSVLIFPEGKRTEHGEIAPFRPGVGMMAARLGVPVDSGATGRHRPRASPDVEDGEARSRARRLRRADAAKWRRLRGVNGAS